MELSYDVIELVPRHVFRTARTTSASSRCVIVTLSDGTLTGVGEAAPSRFYGETADTVVSVLEGVRTVVEDCRNEVELMADLTSRGLRGNPAARASLEIAAHDMMGKRYGMPLYRHFELDRGDAPVTTMSIGLDEPDVMLEKAMEAREFEMLKVKLDAGTDLSIVRAIKEATGSAITVDANCAWSREEAVEKASVLSDIGVEFLEQPVGADDIAGLAYVKERTDVPVYADESCPTSEQIPDVAAAVDGIVIKLMKCGGLVEAVRMAKAARELGLGTMIGCMMESSLAITAAAHISPLMDYADLDSGLLMANDPFRGVIIERGRMILPDEPGLGVHPAE
ncbi:MAG TPA: dipeptide epimerase [bacterium]|nr:dipeptide epimerase [bacterium]